MICSYGCGRKAKFRMTSGRWCCSKHYNSCPYKRKLDSQNKEGKPKSAETRLKMHKFKKGLIPWNKGKTLVQLVGKSRSKQITKKVSLSLAAAHQRGDFEYNAETERLRRKRIGESNKGRTGGYHPGSGRSKGQWYISAIAGKVYLHSSYEVFYAQYLDNHQIEWTKNKIKFPFEWEGETRYYIPDFYLQSTDEYIETKGYKTDKDDAKWRSFPYKLTVLFWKDLKALGFTGS